MIFRILGPLEVEADGRLLRLGSEKQRALLAMLLLNANQVVPQESLIEGLWGELPPDTARTALQVHVSQLRKLLEPARDGREAQLIFTRAPGYLICVEPQTLDLSRFEHLLHEGRTASASADPATAAAKLSEALALWRGRPLSDLDNSPFARLESMRLDELRLAAVEERFNAELALGRHNAVVGELESLVASNPLRERLRGQLMLALYRGDRQAAALEAYQTGRRYLSEELGLEPGEALQRLERAILNHDPSLELAPLQASPRVEQRQRRIALGRRARLLVALGALVLAGVAAAAMVEVTGDERGRVRVPPNSVALIDAATNRLVADVPVGSRPVAVTVGQDGVWVLNADDATVSHVDPRTRKVVTTIGVGGDVSGLAAGYGSVWVAGGNDGTLTRIDPRLDAVEATIDLGGRDPLAPQPVFSVATGEGSVWATSGTRLVQIDPVTNEITRRIRLGSLLSVAISHGAVWVTTMSERILRVEPRTGAVTAKIPVPSQALEPVARGDTLWAIVATGHGQIWRFDANTASPSGTTHTGDLPADLSIGRTALWVANRGDGTASRIDPVTGRVSANVKVGQHPTGIAVGDGFVWVSVEGPSAI